MDNSAAARAPEVEREPVESMSMEALRHEVALLRRVLDTLPASITAWNRERLNVFANAEVTRWWGIPPARMLGMHAHDVVGPARVAEAAERYGAVMAGERRTVAKSVWTPEGRRYRRTIYEPWRNGAGEPDGAVVLVIDLSQLEPELDEPHREIDQAREISERMFRSLADFSPLGIFACDGEGHCFYVNRRWQEISGYTFQHALGGAWIQAVHPDDRERVGRLWAACVAERHDYDAAYRIQRRDGTLRQVRTRARPVEQFGGLLPAGWVGVVEDVTDSLATAAALQQEQALRRQIEQQLEELAALLEERGRMLDVLAHEVRQPLNNASAALQSAAAELAGKGEHSASERLTRAQDVLGAVLAGVDNTLAAATLLAGDRPALLDDADIDTVIAVTIGDMPAHERARIRVHRDTGTRTAAMDVGLTRLALRNLLANALKHSAPDRPVVLRIADSDAPLALLLDVVDRGGGIAAQVLPRLFQRGARGPRERSAGGSPATRAAGSGHGLGLYIARRALELQGGSVQLVETGPQGTTMRIALVQAAGG